MRQEGRAVVQSPERCEIQNIQDMYSKDVDIQEFPGIVLEKEGIQKYPFGSVVQEKGDIQQSLKLYPEEDVMKDISQMEDRKDEDLVRKGGEKIWRVQLKSNCWQGEEGFL